MNLKNNSTLIINKEELNKINTEIRSRLAEFDLKNICVHSDISKLLIFDFKSKPDYLHRHINNLKFAVNDLILWMPTFNYDFIKTNTFNVKDDLSQIGVLNNYFLNISSWRTSTPIFNFCGDGQYPLPSGVFKKITPFDFGFEFDYLYKNNSSYGFYGASISCCTLIHFAEFISGKIKYRYIKSFKGTVNIGQEKNYVILDYFVSPLNTRLNYDWSKIKNDLIDNNLYFEYTLPNKTPYFSFFNVKTVVDYWVSRIIKDPFYLLDEESKQWVIPMIKTLDRGFVKSDFE